MTDLVTDSEEDQTNTYNLGGTPIKRIDAADMDNQEKYRLGSAALKELTGPIRKELTIARILAAISAVLAIAPYVALVQLGTIFLDAQLRGASIDSGAVWWNVFLLVITFVTRLVLYVAALNITHFADNRFRAHIQGLMLDRIGKVPLSWFTATNSGRVRKAIQDDSAQIHMIIAHGPVERTAAVVQPLALLAYAFVIDWRLGLVAIINLPIFGVLYGLMFRGMGEKTAEMDTRLAKVSATMVEFVAGISVVKAFGKVGKAHDRYITAAREFSDFYLAWCEPMLKGSAIAMTAISIAVMLVVNLGVGALVVMSGVVTPVQLLATSLISLVVPASLIVYSMGLWSYQIAGGAALRIKETLETPILEEPATSQVPTSHDVVFEDVHLSYGETKALDGVSLTLKQGTVTALIGPSGSGKSSLATLVARFADPTQGRVSIGGIDLRNIASQDLYRQVAFVLQEPQLLQASIWDNIVMGRPGATREQVIEAAKAAYIHDFVATLPNGYGTIVGKETNLSGGQAQRIAIARALLIDAPILLLDEATAFTDPDSEAEIQRALNRLVTGRTVLVIAHRLSAILGANQIVVLERGQVVASGTHDQLLDNAHYQTLLAMNNPQ